MNAEQLIIFPGAIRQFKALWERDHAGQTPNSFERTLRNTIAAAELLDAKDYPGILSEKPGVSYRLCGGYLFQIEGATNVPAVVSVLNSSTVVRTRRKRKMTAKAGKAPAAPVDISKVVFSSVAIRQFERLSPELQGGDLEREAMNALSKASEHNAIDPAMRVRRLIRHGFQEVLYLRRGNLRFVLTKHDDGAYTVLTVETGLLL